MAFFMRILFSTHQGNLAGSTYSIFYLARGLAERGHEVHLAASQGVLLWRLLKEISNVTCHDVSFRSYWDWSACEHVSQIISEHKIDLWSPQGGRDRHLSILTKWYFRLSVPLVFTRRQRPRNEPWVKRWFHLKGASAIVMISFGLKEIFVQKGYPSHRLTVIQNGIPDLFPLHHPERNLYLKDRYQIAGQPVIGCVARKKAQEQLLNALMYLPEDWILLFVGISEEDIEWDQVRNRPKQRLIFTGQVDHETAMHHYSLMWVNVLPSFLDGFGLAVAEAMSARVAVIGSDFGGIPDLIENGETGFLFPNGDYELLADRLRTLVEDEALRIKMIDKAYQKVQHEFNMNRVVMEYEGLYQSLIASL